MKRELFKVKKSELKDIDEVFENPRPVSLKSFITGYVMINKREAINPEHPDAGDIKDELFKVPVLSHWIHHEKFGDYLVDTGLDKSYSQDPSGKMKGLLAGIFKKFKINTEEYLQEKNQNISFHIHKNSIELKGIFLSHLHSDHIAGARELPKDIPYVVGKGEKYVDHKPFYYGDFLEGIEILYELDFSGGTNLSFLGPCLDIFGDGSFWALPTPGHTRGHVSFLINSEEGPVLLATDACFIKEGFRKGIGSSDYTHDVLMAQASLNNLVEFKKVYPQIKVVCGHEI